MAPLRDVRRGASLGVSRGTRSCEEGTGGEGGASRNVHAGGRGERLRGSRSLVGDRQGRRWRSGRRWDVRGRSLRGRLVVRDCQRNGFVCGDGEVRGGRGDRVSGVEIVDFSQKIVVFLTFGARNAIFDEFDDGGSFLDDLDVPRANDEAATSRKKADDWVVALVAQDVAEFPTSSRGVGVSIGDLEEGYLTGVDAGPAVVFEAFTVEVGAWGAINSFRVGKEVEDRDRVTNEAFNHFVVNRVTKVKDGGVNMFLDGADFAFGEAFVAIGGGELYAKGMLGPEFRSAGDEGWLLVPGEDLGGGTIATPNLDAIADSAGDFHRPFVAEPGNTAELDKAARDDGEEDPHDSEQIPSEVSTGGSRRGGVAADLGVAGAFAPSAGRTGAMYDKGVANVGLSVRDVEEEALAKGENDLVRVDVTEAVTVVIVVSGGSLTLSFGEDDGCAIDIGGVSRSIEVLEVVEKDRDGDRESAFTVGRKDKRGTAVFVKIIFVIAGRVSSDAIASTAKIHPITIQRQPVNGYTGAISPARS